MTHHPYTDPRSIYSKTYKRTPHKILKEILQEYWKNPGDGLNDPFQYLFPDGWLRSIRLYDVIRDLIPPGEAPSILELGTNIGRNLMMLMFGNYEKLHGIELSEIAVQNMLDWFPKSRTIKIQIGAVEDLLYDIVQDEFDIVFTMAVLEHLPIESEHVFKQIANITKQYLITIEDEKCTSWRHFPRAYDKVFKPLGLKQIKVIKRFTGLRTFVCRVFKKEIKE